LHVSAVSEPRGILIPNKKGKKFPKYDLHPTLESTFQHSTKRSQQRKTNMVNHCSLKRTLLQAENRKNSPKQASTHGCSQKKRQSDSQSKTFSQHGKSDFNIGKLKARFNTHTLKNLKEHLAVHLKRQNPDSDRKKQLNLPIFTHRKDMP
jgi:hypothetical protein